MFNRVILLALLVSAMSPISSIAADIKPADKRLKRQRAVVLFMRVTHYEATVT